MAELVFVDVVLLVLLVVTALAVVLMRNLFGATMMLSLYSLLMAIVWTKMNSLDVAFTEASVGAGISTVLLLGALVHVGASEREDRRVVEWRAVVVVLLAGGALIYGTLDMPRIGDPGAPIHRHPVARGYIGQDVPKLGGPGRLPMVRPPATDIGDPSLTGRMGARSARERHDTFHGHVPNMVTSVIVSYRGYDTMFETTVILTAGLAMILLLRPEGDGAWC